MSWTLYVLLFVHLLLLAGKVVDRDRPCSEVEHLPLILFQRALLASPPCDVPHVLDVLALRPLLEGSDPPDVGLNRHLQGQS